MECTAGLKDRPHLDPVAEQHHRDQGRHFLPERHTRVAERHRDAEGESDRDRERDQGHHAGQAGAEFACGPLQEHPSAIDEHRRAEQRGDPLRAGQDRLLTAEQSGEHVAPE
ncbi:hypothetical protein D3C83_59960 [compost metagenome]